MYNLNKACGRCYSHTELWPLSMFLFVAEPLSQILFFFLRRPRVVSRSQQHRQQCSLGVLFEKQITFKNRDRDVGGGSLFLDMANTQKCTGNNAFKGVYFAQN